MQTIGIIGGSGLDDPKLLKNFEEKIVDTPYGKPSSPLTIGELDGKKVVVLARHGRKHQIMPSNVPFRANISALKQEGCQLILASTACGSLREEIEPGMFVFPDQFIDWTKHRIATFFDKEKVCHIPMGEPFCKELRKDLIKTAKEMKLKFKPKGTVITIEGPKFSTRAESKMFRLLGADVINMSTVPEVVLAREAGICYQAIAMSTDYDAWREKEDSIDIQTVFKIFSKNADNVKQLLLKTIPKIKEKEYSCSCATDIESAIVGGD
jgi:5'-methylthioadenosine phosphorylase